MCQIFIGTLLRMSHLWQIHLFTEERIVLGLIPHRNVGRIQRLNISVGFSSMPKMSHKWDVHSVWNSWKAEITSLNNNVAVKSLFLSKALTAIGHGVGMGKKGNGVSAK